MASPHSNALRLSAGPRSLLERPVISIGLAVIASLLLYWRLPGTPFALLPLVIVGGLWVLPRCGPRADQSIFLAFIAVCFFVDDLSQVPWGRDVDIWTEQLGIILFESFGLTGMEFFALAMSGFLLITRSRQQIFAWLPLGLPRILMVAISIFLASCVAGLIGLANGADARTFFIQVRFLHNLVLWTFIGFVLFRDSLFAKRLIQLITWMVVFKSFQALYVYASNFATLREAEYLIDHYFSAFSVIAILGLLRIAYQSVRAPIWLLCTLGLAGVLVAYILNDRRTSYVGFALALALTPGLMPKNWLRRKLPQLILIIGLGMLYVGATWNLPPPLGFVGATVQSFGKEAGTEGPSYRDLENANLINAITSSPITGIGYGQEFEERFPMPDISFVYQRYRMLPHNLFLASWAFGGPLTVAATSLVFVALIWIGGRLMRESGDSELWFIGLVTLFYGLQYFSYTFGDIGLQINRNQMMGGILLGGAYRLLADCKGGRV